jgi:urease accessory protein
VLEGCHTELPLLVQRPLYGPGGQAIVVLLTPAGALFDGDAPRLQVWCGPGVDVTLATASATKLNRCDRSRITFELEVHVADGAEFRYLPYELIPFRGADYLQRVRVALQGAGRAWLLEVIAPGRTVEPFTYTKLDFGTEVRHEDTVVARERFVLTPSSAGQLRGRTHYGSLLVFGPLDAEQTNERMALARNGGVGGASALPGGGVGLKMVGFSAQQVRETLLAAQAPEWLSAALPP